MKKIKIASAYILLFALFLNFQSCIVAVRKDNGKHKGWYKSSAGNHNSMSVNPGNGKIKGKK